MLKAEGFMTKAALYDWSALDRELLAEMVHFTSVNVVGRNLSPTAFSNRIREILRFFKIPVKVRSCYNTKTDKKSVWVGGLYDSVLDQNDATSITLCMQYYSPKVTIRANKNSFRRVCLSVADTILHEVIHMRQYRRRGYKDIPGYDSTAKLARKRNEQIYLGHSDEIDAYSFNIACQLLDRFNGDKKSIVNYLNSDLEDKRLKRDGFKMYLDAFDHNHSHRVIRKLKKKVMNYIPNAVEIAKPYKTSDWLKK
jgi:hypothetical protein